MTWGMWWLAGPPPGPDLPRCAHDSASLPPGDSTGPSAQSSAFVPRIRNAGRALPGPFHATGSTWGCEALGLANALICRPACARADQDRRTREGVAAVKFTVIESAGGVGAGTFGARLSRRRARGRFRRARPAPRGDARARPRLAVRSQLGDVELSGPSGASDEPGRARRRRRLRAVHGQVLRLRSRRRGAPAPLSGPIPSSSPC